MDDAVDDVDDVKDADDVALAVEDDDAKDGVRIEVCLWAEKACTFTSSNDDRDTSISDSVYLIVIRFYNLLINVQCINVSYMNIWNYIN